MDDAAGWLVGNAEPIVHAMRSVSRVMSAEPEVCFLWIGRINFECVYILPSLIFRTGHPGWLIPIYCFHLLERSVDLLAWSSCVARSQGTTVEDWSVFESIGRSKSMICVLPSRYPSSPFTESAGTGPFPNTRQPPFCFFGIAMRASVFSWGSYIIDEYTCLRAIQRITWNDVFGSILDVLGFGCTHSRLAYDGRRLICS